MDPVKAAAAGIETTVPVLREIATPADAPLARDAEAAPRLTVAPTPRRSAEYLSRVPPSPRRQNPWLLVVVDDAPSSYAALVWALREAARREASVVAVAVADGTGDDVDLAAGLDALVERASAESGVTGRARTAVLDAAVLAALTGATRGADLVVVGATGKTLLRPAVARRVARGA